MTLVKIVRLIINSSNFTKNLGMHLKFADTQRYRINIEDRMGGGGIMTLTHI